ncbi:MAG: Na+/H+ antiporter NhaA [Nitrospirales bacterium]
MNLITQAKESENNPPIGKVLSPFNRFIEHEASSGILLCFMTVVALVWANSPYGEGYFTLWQTPVIIGIGEAVLEKPLLKWINDGLMAVFFFVVGLEIKRELMVGELSGPRQALLPVVAALGGMLVPAGLYLFFNYGRSGEMGWAIPMATDIAFALGILALLGDRVPLALKVFLVAFTIVDDLGSILVIAFFYSDHIITTQLLVAGICLLCLIAANALGFRHPIIYSLIGIGGVWLAFLLSGIHATIAGILVALTIPARPRICRREFLQKVETFMGVFKREGTPSSPVLASEKQAEAAEAVKVSGELVQTPLQRLEHILGPWVAFGIMPLFALANAGIVFKEDFTFMLSHTVPMGIMVGLVIGKQVGITVFTWLAVRLGLGKLPEGVTWRQIYGVSWLGGIGFTMSIFITNLAFQDTEIITGAKAGILVASLIAGFVGWTILKLNKVKVEQDS